MDKVDREILYQLQVNGRIPNNELADLVGLSPSPCHRRVRILEESGVIRRFTAVLDPQLVGRGYETLVWVTLREVTRTAMAEIEERFAALEEITEASRMMGQPDYLIRVCVSDAAAYESFTSMFWPPCRTS